MKVSHPLVVIAGLDPAIQHYLASPTAVGADRCAAGGAGMDRRVKPGDDTGAV